MRSRIGLAVTACLAVWTAAGSVVLGTAVVGSAGLLGLASGCARPVVALRSDEPDGSPSPVRATAERIAAWRDELSALEARRIRGADPAAYDRVRGWLGRLAAPELTASTEALLVTAIDGELAVLRTNEQRFGVQTAPVEPPAPRPEAAP